jgi:hypothetical protein
MFFYDRSTKRCVIPLTTTTDTGSTLCFKQLLASDTQQYTHSTSTYQVKNTALVEFVPSFLPGQRVWWKYGDRLYPCVVVQIVGPQTVILYSVTETHFNMVEVGELSPDQNDEQAATNLLGLFTSLQTA